MKASGTRCSSRSRSHRSPPSPPIQKSTRHFSLIWLIIRAENTMSRLGLLLVYFIYGLAFFSMGLTVMLEGGRSADARLRHALRPLAAFGLVHGAHEWL